MTPTTFGVFFCFQETSLTTLDSFLRSPQIQPNGVCPDFLPQKIQRGNFRQIFCSKNSNLTTFGHFFCSKKTGKRTARPFILSNLGNN